MKVIGIVCSPRKDGNTEILVKQALDSAREAGAQTKLFSVIGKNIAPCDACGSCHKTGVCHIQDDMQPLYQQLETADAIIFGSPSIFRHRKRPGQSHNGSNFLIAHGKEAKR